jgi:FMN phosphatase YigB (HAD superfamily)
MPISNRIILTDVDGVLLEWEHHFTKWLQLRSYFDKNGNRNYPYKLLDSGQDNYDMSKRFEISKETISQEIREFNRSAWMGTQRPMLESQTWVKLLHAEGWTFVPITSQTSDIPGQALRKKRLGELFGEHVFSNYHILGTGADKDSALAEFHDTGLYWVEDKPKNALAGLKYGLKPILINHPYNKDFNHPDIIRVNNWKQIHEILSK